MIRFFLLLISGVLLLLLQVAAFPVLGFLHYIPVLVPLFAVAAALFEPHAGRSLFLAGTFGLLGDALSSSFFGLWLAVSFITLVIANRIFISYGRLPVFTAR